MPERKKLSELACLKEVAILLYSFFWKWVPAACGIWLAGAFIVHATTRTLSLMLWSKRQGSVSVQGGVFSGQVFGAITRFIFCRDQITLSLFKKMKASFFEKHIKSFDTDEDYLLL